MNSSTLYFEIEIRESIKSEERRELQNKISRILDQKMFLMETPSNINNLLKCQIVKEQWFSPLIYNF